MEMIEFDYDDDDNENEFTSSAHASAAANGNSAIPEKILSSLSDIFKRNAAEDIEGDGDYFLDKESGGFGEVLHICGYPKVSGMEQDRFWMHWFGDQTKITFDELIKQASQDPKFKSIHLETLDDFIIPEGLFTSLHSESTTYDIYFNDSSAMRAIKEKRVKFHNSIIKKVCTLRKPIGNSWIVIVSGKPSCGKGMIKEILSDYDVLPDESMVYLNMKSLMEMFPEYHMLDVKDKYGKCEMEANFLQKKMINYCIERSQNLWIDSVDSITQESFLEYFPKGKPTNYKMAIIHVFANDETILNRHDVSLASSSSATSSIGTHELKRAGSSYTDTESLTPKATSTNESTRKRYRRHEVSEIRTTLTEDDENRMNSISHFARNMGSDLCLFIDNNNAPSIIKIEDFSLPWTHLRRHFGSIREVTKGFPDALPSLHVDETQLPALITSGIIDFEIISGATQKMDKESFIRDSNLNDSILAPPQAGESLLNSQDAEMESGATQLSTSSKLMDPLPMSFATSSIMSAPLPLQMPFSNINGFGAWAMAKSESDASMYGESDFPKIEHKHVLLSVCSPKDERLKLPKSWEEASSILDAFKNNKSSLSALSRNKSKYSIHIRDDNGVTNLLKDLEGKSCWHIIAHTDLRLYDANTIIFVSADGHNFAISQDTLVNAIKKQSLNKDGKLEMIFINGCKGFELAKRFVRECKIPYVVYWKTIVIDDAASHFGGYFWQEVLSGKDYGTALENARNRVEMITRESDELVEPKIHTPIFKMQVDPEDGDLLEDKRVAAGIVDMIRYKDVRDEAKSALTIKFTLQKPLDKSLLKPEYREFFKLFANKYNNNLELQMSPTCPVNLDPWSREKAGIPDKAVTFSWIYPHRGAKKDIENKVLPSNSNDKLVQMLTLGAFIYFDEFQEIIAVNSVSGDLEGRKRRGIHFSSPQKLSSEDASILYEKRRWSKVTIPLMREAKARYFAWILPRERLQERVYPEYGCFAYLFFDGNPDFNDKSNWDKVGKMFFPISPISS